MERYFKSLFSFRMLHDYYVSNRCDDFSYEVTADTAIVLRRFGLVFKTKSGGFQVIYTGTDESGTPLIPIDENIDLVVKVKLDRSFLHTVSAFPLLAAGAVYLAEALDTDENLTLETRQLRPSVFTYSYQSAIETLTFKVLDSDGNTLSSSVINGVEGEESGSDYAYEYSVNLKGHAAGEYNIQVLNGVSTVSDTAFRIDDEMAGSDLFAYLRFPLSAGLDYSAATEYNIQLERNTAVWEYHIQLTRDYDDYTFELDDADHLYIDTGETGTTNFYDAYVFSFTKTTDPATYEAGEVIVFTCDTSIPWYEQPKKELRLTISNGSETKTLLGLPNPSVLNLRPQIFINV